MKPMLAKHYTEETNPAGYWISEKFDGIRAIWTGSELISRNGNPFTAPAWFTARLPRGIRLDGEIHGGRGTLQSTAAEVRKKAGDWQGLKFLVFDIQSAAPFEARLSALHELSLPAHCEVVDYCRCKGPRNLAKFQAAVLAAGGEGVMLRAPGSLYTQGRSSSLLKLKQYSDAEAEVIGHTATSLVCRMGEAIFKLSSGVIRSALPPLGSLVTVSFCGLTASGIPREACFLGVRDYE